MTGSVDERSGATRCPSFEVLYCDVGIMNEVCYCGEPPYPEDELDGEW